EAVVSEGIATIALDVALGEEVDVVAARVYSELGIDYDAETSRAVRALRGDLAGLRVNAARLLHVEGCSGDEVGDYVERWSLDTRERAEGTIRFVTHPSWRAYASSYSS